MKVVKSSNHTWMVDGVAMNCRTQVKALVMQDYYARNKINPITSLENPAEFRKHHFAIKALYKEYGLES